MPQFSRPYPICTVLVVAESPPNSPWEEAKPLAATTLALTLQPLACHHRPKPGPRFWLLASGAPARFSRLSTVLLG